MSWLFSRALVEEYSVGTCLAGEPSAPSSGNPTPQAYLPPDKMTAFSRLSRFGMMFVPLTADHGQALLMSYLAAFPARTSAQPAQAQGWTASEAGCGQKWHGLLARYDRDTRSWKTPQCSLLGGLDEFSETWPRWGSMRNGECYLRPTPALPIYESASGLWQTPVADDAVERKVGKWNSRGEPKLSAEVKLWPTPCARDYFPPHKPEYIAAKKAQGHGMSNLNDSVGGHLNPAWVEWLMGWPLGWTESKPLEMGKFREWQQQHLPCSAQDRLAA